MSDFLWLEAYSYNILCSKWVLKTTGYSHPSDSHGVTLLFLIDSIKVVSLNIPDDTDLNLTHIFYNIQSLYNLLRFFSLLFLCFCCFGFDLLYSQGIVKSSSSNVINTMILFPTFLTMLCALGQFHSIGIVYTSAPSFHHLLYVAWNRFSPYFMSSWHLGSQ